MNQNREDRQSVPNRTSQMEPADGSRETVEESMSDRERMRNREGSGERGSGGITNRGLEREQSEQEQVPERGRSQSER